jgi:hypothetical protein
LVEGLAEGHIVLMLSVAIGRAADPPQEGPGDQHVVRVKRVILPEADQAVFASGDENKVQAVSVMF